MQIKTVQSSLSISVTQICKVLQQTHIHKQIFFNSLLILFHICSKIQICINVNNPSCTQIWLTMTILSSPAREMVIPRYHNQLSMWRTGCSMHIHVLDSSLFKLKNRSSLKDWQECFLSFLSTIHFPLSLIHFKFCLNV